MRWCLQQAGQTWIIKMYMGQGRKQCASVSTLLKKMEAQDFIRREKVSYDDRLKRILPTSHTVEMKEQVERHITLLEKRLTAGIGEEELRVFSDVLKKMQENMELTEKGDRYG